MYAIRSYYVHGAPLWYPGADTSNGRIVPAPAENDTHRRGPYAGKNDDAYAPIHDGSVYQLSGRPGPVHVYQQHHLNGAAVLHTKDFRITSYNVCYTKLLRTKQVINSQINTFRKENNKWKGGASVSPFFILPFH